MKTQITTTGQPAMMSSKEIAELTGKRPADVIRDIWVILESLYSINKDNADLRHHKNHKVTVTDGVIAYFDNRGYVSEFLLDRRHTEILITGYDVKRRAAVIDRWFSLESGEAQPRIAAQFVQPEIGISPDFAALTRTVAEATASAMMKTILETTGIQATVRVNATVSAPPVTESVITVQQDDEKPVDEGEYVPIHKVSWDSGLTDSTCRRLVDFAELPNGYVNGVRGLCVHYAIFMMAVRALIDESTPPTGKRKRWQHPEFGGFSLRKDPQEIFGEAA
ncbi:Rha family transcriptional regulator [Salmonella enterica subsp. enterica serovar Newport]|nr:Rha family transcriptional regulator [Salmonella enterica subsp. enterica serovar Infantis]ECO0902272.1 Rha family transcriptional regulator [Salmonella enterica subsp. enterica serovar Newport]EGI5077991.1 transcriptional regulator [Salmonella enterica subsp. enterica serovar Infantis]